MKTRFQTSWVFALLLTSAFTCWYVVHNSYEKKLDKEYLNLQVDMIVKDLELKQFDEEGKLINSISAPLMKHIPNKNQHWLQNPVILITEQNKTLWQIKSQFANSLNGGKKIILTNDVEIKKISEEPDLEETLTTSKLIYLPKNKFAYTSQEVVLKQGGNIIEAEGMKVDLAKKRVKFLNRTRGKYEPKKS